MAFFKWVRSLFGITETARAEIAALPSYPAKRPYSVGPILARQFMTWALDQCSRFDHEVIMVSHDAPAHLRPVRILNHPDGPRLVFTDGSHVTLVGHGMAVCRAADDEPMSRP